LPFLEVPGDFDRLVLTMKESNYQMRGPRSTWRSAGSRCNHRALRILDTTLDRSRLVVCPGAH